MDVTEQVEEGQPRGLTRDGLSAHPEDGSWDSESVGWAGEVDAESLTGRVLSVQEQRGFGALGGARREKPAGRGTRQGSRAAPQCPRPAPGHEAPSPSPRAAPGGPGACSPSLRLPICMSSQARTFPRVQSITMVISLAPILAPPPARRLSMAFLTALRLSRTNRTMVLLY